MSSTAFWKTTNRSSDERFVNISHSTLHQKRVDLVHNLREGPRLRRRHTKSRNGCIACKQRRIKCDEAVPKCGNCMKREGNCVRSNPESSRASSASPSSPPVTQGKHPRRREISPPTRPSLEALCLVEECDFQRELMHHFVTHTATTLVFTPELWRGPLLRLSLQVDYLHNAILLIAATHRSVLATSTDRQRGQYHNAARNYLAKTLHGYQDALSNPISSTPGDALIAVSLLLYHYAWSSIDQAAVPLTLSESPAISRELASELDLSSDPLMNLSVGLRYLFWKTGALATDSESPFHTYALERPRVRIVEAVQRQQQPHNSLGRMESYLLGGYDSHGSSIVESTDSSEPQVTPDRVVDDPIALAAYSESAGRLAPILALMFSSVAIQDEPVISNGTNHDRGPAVRISDIIRYLFSYPIHFCHTFRSLVATHARRALFLLLHFFRAVRRLLPADRCWWAQRRAMLLESQLECIIKVESAVPEQGAVERLSSLGLDAQGTECVSYPMRDWLNGECIHGQF